ncbi:4-hydroxy-tetrahydrodipicolinate reductase [Pseudofulvimonas gallinarii]|uniref:4-hydroxy-tetrahydrodipicolinate reductase n=1 Tax=Pseudofulvimonas gallinarii TaxID=634155 RepID=A0A4R3L771_9GAMM|nr:4-hydroxy-tetrahydrodipicolinate reductase [Pseudofulvimonas gallinarii]TCS95322.1 dihydrodipicolinate reductase [Pseudofulvimonas gallinarii]THD12663.1 4-hydroxy-tetrahydrodipicolinate reductase [Pseudofulvimonas gallinarii]
MNPTFPASDVLPLVVAGASGRMGRQLLDVVATHADLELVGAWVREDSVSFGLPVPGSRRRFAATGDVAAPPRVVVDFSHASAFDAVLEWCVGHRVALVSGTTGLDDQQHARLSSAAVEIPLLWAANFSLGVAVLSRLVADAARSLPGWDAEILEAHHAGKRDAPSGTALALGRVLAAARGRTLDELAVHDRHDRDRARQAGEIGFASLRAGDIVGEHTVLLAVAGERLELGHRATDRAIFARGAVHAARWLAAQAPGLYAIDDTLD